MNSWIKRGELAGALAAVWFVGLPAAQATDYRTQTAVQQATAGSHGFSEQKLDAFVAAYVRVAEVYNHHAARIEAAQSSEQVYQAQAAINSESSRVIQEQGLRPDEYDLVVRAINENPELARAVAQKIRALQ